MWAVADLELRRGAPGWGIGRGRAFEEFMGVGGGMVRRRQAIGTRRDMVKNLPSSSSLTIRNSHYSELQRRKAC